MSDGSADDPVGGGAVRFRSTRAPGGSATDLDAALLRGLADDGGLFLPERVPRLPGDWRDAGDLAELGARVLAPWLGESERAAAELLGDALAIPVPLRPLSDRRWLVELFHGPTLSFKDFGARVMARLTARALARREGRATVLVATSGDTGSAVADGFAGQPGLEVVLLYPEGKVSPVQERQLIAEREGVRAFAVRGAFDDCQRMVKAAFRDPDLRELGLTSANSINVGRLLPQSLYYLWAARQLEVEAGEGRPARFVVPSGNLGNLTAGVLAERMGLPVEGWLAAHNANDYFPEFLAARRGAFDYRGTVATLSNAMDVGAPSNFERLHALLDDALPGRIDGASVDDAATLARMARTEREEGLQVCPHTAVGLEALARWRAASGGVDVPALVLATAHPAKFPEAVRRATGRDPEPAPALEALKSAPTRVEPLEPTAEALRAVLLA